MKFKTFAVIFSLLILLGCQKYGLSFSTEDSKVVSNNFDEEQFEQELETHMINTQALIMKGNTLDLTGISMKPVVFEFENFKIKLLPDIFDKQNYFRYMLYEPFNQENDYSVEYELDKEGRIIKEMVVQKKNNEVIHVNELKFAR